MTNHCFTLQIEGIDREEFGDFCEAIYALADDCTASFRSGVAYAWFDREAAGLRAAIATAIADVHRAAPSSAVVGILMDDGRPIDSAVATAL